MKNRNSKYSFQEKILFTGNKISRVLLIKSAKKELKYFIQLIMKRGEDSE